MSLPQDRGLYRDTIQKFLGVYRYVRQYGRQMQQEGISGRKISTLRYLADAGPLTVGQLGDYLCIGDSSTSELIGWLKHKGLASRRRSEQDNRVVLVEITPAGRNLIEATPLGGIPLLREAIRGLSPERLVTINQAMGDILDLLEISDEK